MSVGRGVTPLAPNRRRGATGAVAPQGFGRVLILEDEHDVAELIRYNLVKEGYDVTLAGKEPSGNKVGNRRARSSSTPRRALNFPAIAATGRMHRQSTAQRTKT